MKKQLNYPKLKSCTAQNNQNQLVFYKRQLDKNIINCHQKYKLNRRRSLSLIQKIPLIYKSTKHTSIDFDELMHVEDLVLRPTVQINQKFHQTILKKQNQNYFERDSSKAYINTQTQKSVQYQKNLNEKLTFFKDSIESLKSQKKKVLKKIQQVMEGSKFDIFKNSENKFPLKQQKRGFQSIMNLGFGFNPTGWMIGVDQNNHKVKRLKKF